MNEMKHDEIKPQRSWILHIYKAIRSISLKMCYIANVTLSKILSDMLTNSKNHYFNFLK